MYLERKDGDRRLQLMPESTKKIGIFGGTFDPVHLGHLIMAEQCREQGQLDEVWFIPAARPPHKQEQEVTSFARRVEMRALALAGQPHFRINELEKDRPGPSFTVETLGELQQQYAAEQWFLIVGSDCLPDLPSWREPARILNMATLLIAARPGWTLEAPDQLRASLHLPPEVPLRHQFVVMPLIDIASRDVRRRCAER